METHFPTFEAHRAASWRRLIPGRRLLVGALIWTAALASPLWLSGCADFSEPPPPSQTAQLCTQWGYAPNDPVCLNTFRRDHSNH
jgi:hypothetical protein